MNPIELKALQRARVNFLENLDVDHVKDHLIQYDVSPNRSFTGTCVKVL